MRFRARLLVMSMMMFVVAPALYLLLSRHMDTGDSAAGIISCDLGDDYRTRLLTLLERVVAVLSIESIRPFLCYESLWGALKAGQPLKWSVKATLCAQNEELEGVDEVYLGRHFRRRGLNVVYDGRNGLYRITASASTQAFADVPTADDSGGEGPTAMVELILFEQLSMGIDEKDTEPQLRRIGWLYRLMPPNSEAIDKFPQRLVVAPPELPVVDFGRLKLAAPRESIELQKYHYRDNWWLDITPKGCRSV